MSRLGRTVSIVTERLPTSDQVFRDFSRKQVVQTASARWHPMLHGRVLVESVNYVSIMFFFNAIMMALIHT